jgi:hypothetical protein
MTTIFTYADGSTLYKLTARAFISDRFPVWEANRTMDDAHVSDLESAIRSPTEIQGPFSVISYIDDDKRPQNRVLDGQHRREVIRRYFDRNPAAADWDILVRRYGGAELRGEAAHDVAVAIFQQINHSKPMIYKGSSTERLHEYVAALRRHFVGERGDGSIVALIRPNCNRPYLSTETLEKAITTYRIHERYDLDAGQLVAHAESMNAFYAEDMNRINAHFTKHTLDRAIEYGFYLGLDPKCSWLLPLRPT